MKNLPETRKLKDIAMVAELSDGTFHSVVLEETTRQAIISLIVVMDKSVKIVDEPLNGITFTYA